QCDKNGLGCIGNRGNSIRGEDGQCFEIRQPFVLCLSSGDGLTNQQAFETFRSIAWYQCHFCCSSNPPLTRRNARRCGGTKRTLSSPGRLPLTTSLRSNRLGSSSSMSGSSSSISGFASSLASPCRD